jgi:hypothetical protein
MSYPVGRDLVEQSLRTAQARVGTLTFGVPSTGYLPAEGRSILEVFWFGDDRSRCLSDPQSPAACLFMRMWAVPSTQSAEIGTLLTDCLPVACRWVAQAVGRGKVWSATEHVWTVRYERGALHTAET